MPLNAPLLSRHRRRGPLRVAVVVVNRGRRRRGPLRRRRYRLRGRGRGRVYLSHLPCSCFFARRPRQLLNHAHLNSVTHSQPASQGSEGGSNR